MQKLGNGQRALWLLIVVAAVVIPPGCGDDDDPAAPGGGTRYDTPDGVWDVTATDTDVVIVDSNLPAALEPYVEAFIDQAVNGDGSSVWDIEKTTLLVPVLQMVTTPLCEPIVVPFNEGTRKAAASLPVTLNDMDVSAYDLCQELPGAGQACVSTFSFSGIVATDLEWDAGYRSFGGTLAMGTPQNAARATVSVTGTGAGSYTVDFRGTWTLSGSRCPDCAPCQ